MNNHNHFNHHSKTKSEVSQYGGEDDAPLNRKLPKELLLRIFSFLDVVTLCRCAQVSKYWNVLALDGSNWQRVNLFDFQTDVEGPVVENLSKRCGGFLKSLSLRGCQCITDGALKIFSQQCRNIEELNLNNCKKITDITCESLGKHCDKLTWLDLESCSTITDNSLKALGDGCHYLMYINLSWCTQITNDGFDALTRGCKQLKKVMCAGCSQVTDSGIGYLALNCPGLTKLNLHSCSHITDDAIHKISDNCPNLQFLCVLNCSLLTDASLVSLGQGCPDLKTLEVAGCSQFTDNGFQALTRSCHQLQQMDLEECVLITDATLGHLSMHCPRLSALLDFNNLDLLYGMVFHPLFATTSVYDDTKEIYCIKINSLSHCELITDDGIRHLGGGACATEHLTVLELDNCPLITDASLEHLMGCQCLERIDLYDCQLITRSGIRRLRMHLPEILVHAYFAPVTPPPSVGGSRQRYCRCCAIL